MDLKGNAGPPPLCFQDLLSAIMGGKIPCGHSGKKWKLIQPYQSQLLRSAGWLDASGSLAFVKARLPLVEGTFEWQTRFGSYTFAFISKLLL